MNEWKGKRYAGTGEPNTFYTNEQQRVKARLTKGTRT